MKRKIALMTSGAALLGLGLFVNTPAFAENNPTAPPAAVAEHHERHPAIHTAIRALEEARVELKNASHDFGGHREAALKECDAAIAQLKLALQFDK